MVSGLVLPILHPSSVINIMPIRLKSFLPEHADDIAGCDWQQVGVTLRRCSPHCAMCFIKSATNAWATTHRYHETRRLRSIFGCPDAPDTIHHYITRCSRFWHNIYDQAGAAYHDDPLMRLGVASPSPQAVQVIAIAYTTYHAIRNVDAVIILKADDTGDYTSVHSRLTEHAAIAAKNITYLFHGSLPLSSYAMRVVCS